MSPSRKTAQRREQIIRGLMRAVAKRGYRGAPVTESFPPSASDALSILQTAVGMSSCALCICDVDSGGSVAASDALRVLQSAVGLSVTLVCPAC